MSDAVNAEQGITEVSCAPCGGLGWSCEGCAYEVGGECVSTDGCPPCAACKGKGRVVVCPDSIARGMYVVGYVWTSHTGHRWECTAIDAETGACTWAQLPIEVK